MNVKKKYDDKSIIVKTNNMSKINLNCFYCDCYCSGGSSWLSFKFFVLSLIVILFCLPSSNVHCDPQSNLDLSKIRYLFQNETNLLSADPVCRDELQALCGHDPKILQNNVEIMNCIFERSDADRKLSPECQNQIWQFKMQVTKLDHFTDLTQTVCKTLLNDNHDCLEAAHEDSLSPGANILSCLIERIQPEIDDHCRLYLQQMELIIFSDYRLINQFTNACETKIKDLKCGRLDWDSSTHSQVNTIECLQKHLPQLPEDCQNQILRISELQSNDFHLDKPLYFACRMDREKFCKSIESGNGKIYKCLMAHLDEPEMSEDCKVKLMQREQLITKDYKISKSLVQSCLHDIQTYECVSQKNSQKEVALSQILLCLENVHAKGLPLNNECQAEMLLHRRFLFENYKLTPNLVDSCQNDIDEFCSNVEFGAKILHCLMKNAKAKRRRGDAHNRRKISSKCQREVEQLLKEVNIAEDWRVDPVLQEACQSTVDSLCSHVRPGNGRILACLAENVDSKQMATECREALNQMQYFVVRNFDLDSEIYEACHEDAVKYCHARHDWYEEVDEMDPERGPTVMACLYRYVYQPEVRNKTIQLQKQCVYHIKRVMKNRASSVDLLPFIEGPCMQDLAEYCSADFVTKKGYEMECLQDNYQRLRAQCQNAIGNFTEIQSSNFELNYPLFKSCLTVAKEFCPSEYESDDPQQQQDVIKCLIKHKNHFQVKNNGHCRMAIEHYQMINSKDFRFDPKFKQACKDDIEINCVNLRTKYDVVNCLSTLVYNDSMDGGSKHKRISGECRRMLREELLQFNEDISLDPSLMEACQKDRQKFCADVQAGESHVLECLKTNIIRLSKACQRKLFRKQYIELVDNAVDYSLLSICKIAINKHCILSDLHDVLYCLRDHRNDPGVSHNCRSLVLKRLAQQNQDYRLNPRLKSGCKTEINKYCSTIIAKSRPEELLDGKVIACLKKQYLHNTLSQSCEVEIINIIREVSLNIELDPVLYRKCQKEIHKRCSNEMDIHECLKRKFLAKQIDDAACKHEVARLIKETEADIESDPHLYQVCLSDLKTFCSDVVPGRGHQLNCLAIIHRNSPHRLSPECDTLLQKRIQLFEYASEVDNTMLGPDDGVVQVFHLVSQSPAHNYFYLIFLAMIMLIFFSGLFCGRIYQPIPTSDKIK